MSRLTRIPTALAGDPNSQNANINSLIHPVVWAGTALTYSFPTDPSQYTGYAAGEEPFQSFAAAAASYRAAVKFSLDSLSEFTNLTFTEIAPSVANPATMRFGISGDAEPTPGQPVQADLAGWGYLPADTARAGDIWIKNNQNINAPFQPGAFRWSLVVHEVGHGMGLGHPFSPGNLGGDVVMDPSRDSTEYTIMAYRASTTVPSVQTVGHPETGGEPQTWMQYDVAAFQYLYGANFNTRAGNTVYSWNPATGQMSIDGVAYSQAPEINRILMNVWDGNGIDTYDFSNYTTDVRSDLRPGEWSTPSLTQLPVTNTQAIPTPARAPGSISNSLLFNGDERSLIENVSGGSGNDILSGNQAANLIKGNNGNDTLSGLGGNDTLDGGAGNDLLNGGADIDTAAFDGVSGYTVKYGSTAANLVMRTNFGEDTLVDIENVTFTNATHSTKALTQVFANPIIGIASFGADLAAGGWNSDRQYPRTLADVNNDGRADIIGFGGAGTYVALANANGSGTFGNTFFGINSYGFDLAAGGWADNDRFPRTLGDVNGDGRADIIGFGGAATFVSLARADNSGMFAGPIFGINSFGADASAGGWSSDTLYHRTLADVNGDRRADIVGFGGAGAFVALANANGSGTFLNPILGINSFGTDLGAGGWANNDRFMRTLADVNGDGRADIVGFGGAGVFVALARADNSGTFLDPILGINSFGADIGAGGWNSDNIFRRELADINNDGRADIIGFGGAGTFVALAKADNSGTFSAPFLAIDSFGSQTAAGGWLNNDLFPRTVADVTGDGRADIVGFGGAGTFVASANNWFFV